MFDPAYPATNALIESAPLRSQFTGLKALIDAVPGVTSALIGTVGTLPPGSAATAELNIVDGVLILNLGIPQGLEGATGPQGLPGEVTQTDLNNAVTTMTNNSSSNSNAVGTLGTVASGSYDPSQMQSLLDKMDELIGALRR